MSKRYALGVDYGTNSVRALIVDCADGREVSTHVFNFPSGTDGVILDERDPNLARQHPGDWERGFVETVRAVVASAGASEPGFEPGQVVGIGIDTTGSSPLPLNRDGVPLGNIHPDNPHAQCWLWKDHTSVAEADEITELARKMDRPFLRKCGGTYSSEWFWSKILHCARVAPEIFAEAHTWCECQDYIPAWATGTLPQMKRGICAAGHKAMFSTEWGGLPDKEFLNALDPRLADLRDRLYTETFTADQVAGGLRRDLAEQVGLNPDTPIAVGAMDAHLGAVGAGVKPGTLVKIMGTSTCDIMVGEGDVPDITGVCGIVPGSVIPGMIGIEAGQSAVGDLFAWAARVTGRGHEELTEDASMIKPGASGLIALDWNNGNRTVLVDQALTGLLIGQTLATTPAEIYRAVIEATAFGALKIIERIEENGVPIKEIVACGGIADKSPLVMQIYADVCGRPIKTSRSAQTCALGACIFASVAGGAHPDVLTAQVAMTGFHERTFEPDPAAHKIYQRLYRVYSDLHDAFGETGRNPNLNQVMKDLIAIRTEVRQ